MVLMRQLSQANKAARNLVTECGAGREVMRNEPFERASPWFVAKRPPYCGLG